MNDNDSNLSSQLKDLQFNYFRVENDNNKLNDFYKMLCNERKNIISILSSLSKGFHSSDIGGILNEITSNIDKIYNMHMDKVNLKHRLKEIEYKTKNDQINNTLLTSIVNEISNIKAFLSDLDNKIGK